MHAMAGVLACWRLARANGQDHTGSQALGRRGDEYREMQMTSRLQKIPGEMKQLA